MNINGTEWTEITYDQIAEGMRILTVTEESRVTLTREGVATKRTEGAGEAWWGGSAFIVGPDMAGTTIYTTAESETVRRPIKAVELLSNIGATIERTETLEIIAAPDSPIGWCYRGVPGAKTRHVVIAEADPILATIRKSLDV